MASRSHLYQAYRERSQRLLVSSLLWNLPRVHPQVGEIFELIWHRFINPGLLVQHVTSHGDTHRIEGDAL